jgi:hypothetical protein
LDILHVIDNTCRICLDGDYDCKCPKGMIRMEQRTKIERVIPKEFEGFNMSIFQFFGSGPKFTIICGKCEFKFRKRIPVVNNPTVVCPYCNTINVLPTTT